MDLSIIIPCFNEIENVAGKPAEVLPVVRALAGKLAVELVFVDDGSTDGTGAALHAAFAGAAGEAVEVQICQHAENRGLGAALRTGFAAARGHLLVTTDSDGTYRFAEIPALLAHLTPQVDLVTASPYHPAGGVAGVAAYRRVLSQGSSLMYRALVDPRLHTYTALFRAYRRQVVEALPFAANDFLAGTELLVKAVLAGYRVAEYPTVLHARAHGVSKAKLLRTIRAHLRFQGQVLLHRLRVRRLAAPRAEPGGQLWAPSTLTSAGEQRQ